LYEAVGVAPGDRAASAAQAMRNFELFGAPHLAIVTVDGSLGTYGVLDAGVYLASFLLAAESLGVATIAQAALATYADFVKNFFDVPSDRKVLVGVSFGRPDTGHPANSFRTERAAVADIVHWSAE
jgi:nitroreductase